MPDRTNAPIEATDAPGEATSSLDRRSVLKGLAIAGAAVPVLAACGSSSNGGTKTPTGGGGGGGGGGSTTTPSGGGGGGGGSSSDVLAKVSAVPVGGGVILTSSNTVITQPTKGTFEGFSAVCTHMGCIVDKIANGRIMCPCHGSQYSISTGAVEAGPAPAPLPKKPVKVDGANIVAG